MTQPFPPKKMVVLDALVCAAATFFASGWFYEVLQLRGILALFLVMFGGARLVRYMGEQLETLQWAKLNEVVLVQKKPPAPARGDGYREAAVIEEALSIEDEYLACELPRRRRHAQVVLGIIGSVAWLLTFIPAIMWGAWAVPGVVTFIAALYAAMLWGIRMRREQEAKTRDFFTDNLSQDTAEMLDPKRARIAEESEHLRVGVDFGVPVTREALDDADTAEPAKRAR